MIEKIELLEQNAFNVIGISVRTINKDGQSQQDIGALFGAFLGGNLASQINDKISDDIYCVYTDYETDHTGYYTCILGCKAHTLARIPAGFVGVTVPAGSYRHYQVKGALPQSVGNAWLQIWETEPNRRFTADYDVYGVNAQNPDDAEMDIYVAI
ncbi:hypothetical protein BH09BAC6_BH09BAC6_36680 [soil metagenome]|jgi:predicted transcriptional regulator YdeE